jgi:hypothetical protein
VRRGASTLRLLLPAPRNEVFALDAPRRASARATGIRLAGDVTVDAKDDEARIDVPIDASGPGALSVDVELYAGQQGKPYTRVGRATIEVPVVVADGPGGVVEVPARIQ